MGEQKHSWRPAHVLTHHRACVQSWGKTCKHKIPAVQLLGQKNLESWGYLKPVVFCSFCFSMWQDKALAAPKPRPFIVPTATPSPCWKLLLLQSPIGGHHSFTQGSKARKHVINHRNTSLSRTKTSLFKCKQAALALQRHYLTFREVLQSAVLHGFTQPLRKQMKKKPTKENTYKKVSLFAVTLEYFTHNIEELRKQNYYFFLLWPVQIVTILKDRILSQKEIPQDLFRCTSILEAISREGQITQKRNVSTNHVCLDS